MPPKKKSNNVYAPGPAAANRECVDRQGRAVECRMPPECEMGNVPGTEERS